VREPISRLIQPAHHRTNPTRLLSHPFVSALSWQGTAGIVSTAHLQNYNSWWHGERGRFHLGEDGTQYLHADKWGHFFFTYVTSDIISRSLIWSGVPKGEAFWYGGGIATAFQLYVEIEDAFHPELGFSLGDAFADLAGAVLPALQEDVPAFGPLSLKWSAIPSARYKDGSYRTLIDDYESQYYWLSWNIKDVVGKNCPSIIPGFLNIALGYGVKNLGEHGNGTPELYVGLDCDFRKLPGEGELLSTVKHVLNYFHCPAPTIRITHDIIFYWVRF